MISRINPVVHIGIQILHKEPLREAAKGSSPAEDRRAFEDGLLTKH